MQSDSSPKSDLDNDATTSRTDDVWAKDLDNLESFFSDENKPTSSNNFRDKLSVEQPKKCLSASNLLKDSTKKSTDNLNDKLIDKSSKKSSDKLKSTERCSKTTQLSENEEDDEDDEMEVDEAKSSEESYSDEQEDEEKTDENTSVNKLGAKKRKKKSQFERRNIKKLIKDEDLGEKILSARKEEEDRINRILEQQKQLKTEQQTFSFTPSNSRFKSDIDIVLSSDEEEVNLIDSSDGEDIVISYERIQDELDAANSGLHTDDSLNTLNADGRCLINVGHPSSDPDVFLDDYLGRIVKPHQIGGIRFMYDCIVENLKKVKTSQGIGGCILAHSMGLGKTLQIVAFTELYYRLTKKNRILCIVPVNTIQNWMSEYDLWLPDEHDLIRIKESGVDCSNTVTGNDIKLENIDNKLGNDELMLLRKPGQFKVYTLAELKTISQRTTEIRKWYQTGGVLLIGYEIYRIFFSDDENKRKNRSKFPDGLSESEYSTLVEEAMKSLIDPGPDLVICDEGHRIKNCKASISKALKKVRTKRRIILTGYPLQNNLIEYWCMVDFIRPGYLGKKNSFTNMFERPIVNGQCIDSEEGDRILALKRAHVLHKLLIGFVQRRSFKILLRTLPAKQEFCLYVRMSEFQKCLLLALYQHLGTVDESGRKFATNPINIYSICCKIWNSPDLLARYMTNHNNGEDFEMGDLTQKKSMKTATAGELSDEEDFNYDWANELMSTYQTGQIENSVKMVLLFEIIDATLKLGERLLIFSQSLYTLDLIEYFLAQRTPPNSKSDTKFKRLVNYFRLDGSTAGIDRINYIELFNNDKRYHLFLISTKAGSLGINLTGANRLVVFDISFNPCHDAQAVHRIYRYGQTKKCYVYRFIFDNSLEKRIFDRQIKKQGMSNQVVDEMNTSAQIMTNDIISLTDGLQNIDESPIPVFSEKELNAFDDPVMRIICKKHNHLLTKKPLPHESLLAESEETKLSRAQKQIAEAEYNEEIRYMRGQNSPRNRFEPPTQNYQESKPSTSSYNLSNSMYNPFINNNQSSVLNQNYRSDFHINPAFYSSNAQSSSNQFSFTNQPINNGFNYNNNHQSIVNQSNFDQNYQMNLNQSVHNQVVYNQNPNYSNTINSVPTSFNSTSLSQNHALTTLHPNSSSLPSSSFSQPTYQQFNPYTSNLNETLERNQFYNPTQNPSVNASFTSSQEQPIPQIRNFVVPQDLKIKDHTGTEINLKKNQQVLLVQAENSLILRTYSGKQIQIKGAVANFFNANAVNQPNLNNIRSQTTSVNLNNSSGKSQVQPELISLSDEE